MLDNVRSKGLIDFVAAAAVDIVVAMPDRVGIGRCLQMVGKTEASDTDSKVLYRNID